MYICRRLIKELFMSNKEENAVIPMSTYNRFKKIESDYLSDIEKIQRCKEKDIRNNANEYESLVAELKEKSKTHIIEFKKTQSEAYQDYMDLIRNRDMFEGSKNGFYYGTEKIRFYSNSDDFLTKHQSNVNEKLENSEKLNEVLTNDIKLIKAECKNKSNSIAPLIIFTIIGGIIGKFIL
jgi:hypothetical protein